MGIADFMGRMGVEVWGNWCKRFREVGDSIVTTGGFYGVVIDMTEEDVIVEFGNNKNCRIPMRKQAIAEVEKAGSAAE